MMNANRVRGVCVWILLSSVVGLVNPNSSDAETVFFDDFNDGSISNDVPLDRDGDPVIWSVGFDSDLLVEEGDLVVRGSGTTDAGVIDVSMQVQSQLVEGNFMGIVVRRSFPPAGYYGLVTADGNVEIGVRGSQQTLAQGEAEEEDPLAEFNRQLEVAREMVKSGELGEGIKALNGLAEAFQHAPAYMLVGQSFEELGDYDFAIGAYSKAITAPGSTVRAAAHLSRGQLFLKKQKFREAMNDFTQVLEIDPVNSKAHYGLGRTLLGRVNQEANSDRERKVMWAIESFDRAIRFDKEDALAHYERGMAKAMLGQESDAQHDLSQALSLERDGELNQRLVELTVRLQTENQSLRAKVDKLEGDAKSEKTLATGQVEGINKMAETLLEIRDLLRVQTARR